MKVNENEIKHIGVARRSGRYPWGSGKDPAQRNPSLADNVESLKKEGLSEDEIAKGLGTSTTKLRASRSIEKDAKRMADADLAIRLRDKGLSNVAIGKRMGRNESSVRALLNPVLQERAAITRKVADVLKNAVDEKKYIDVGSGVEQYLGVSRTKLNTAIYMLEQEGYKQHYLNFEQLGTGKRTSMKVLAAPGTTWSEINKNKHEISMITDPRSEDGGRSFFGLKPVNNIDSNRIQVKYYEDGGSNKDGVIELRRGVEDISLGNKHYAQVRIGVDGTHYMKGMAIYSDDIPEGKDIVYNTNKHVGANKDQVFKPMKDEPDNPFGASVIQREYIGSDGKTHLSALNVVGSRNEKGIENANEEGKWSNWKKAISSQILSKQNASLAKKQLGLYYDAKKQDYDELMSLTNPVVKKRLLQTFADKCDSAAVDLDAAALPRQSSHVLLPLTSIKESEIYAPRFNNGESVVLIRHPHGGIFEIPELIVNNKNPEGEKLIGDSQDAVGIHPKVASKLSGADFDGDAVIVIPNKNGYIKTAPSLRALKDFDAKETYRPYDGMVTIDGGIYNSQTGKVDYGKKPPKKQNLQMQMGVVSNLITDMTIKGANEDEIARAVKHSMCVIDSEKHHLDYKRSALENNIPALKKKYQGGEKAGASTLISRAGAQQRVMLRKAETGIDPQTGKKIYKYFTGETIVNSKGHKVRLTTESEAEARRLGGEKYVVTARKDKETGLLVPLKTPKVITRTTLSTRMAETDDAFKLSSGTPIETVYAEHANRLKSLGNLARKSILETNDIIYSPSAAKVYAQEINSLEAKLNIAYRNKPLERKAQLLANKVVATKKQANPQMSPEEIKKMKGQVLTEERLRIQAKKDSVEITDKEWEAIQAGAISNSRLTQILLNTDVEKLKERAMPHNKILMPSSKISRANSLLNTGLSRAEVSEMLGVSLSTLNRALG
jgi:predicted transcriptional regulator